MDDPMKIDLAIIAKDLKLSPDKVEKTVELLDSGNTIPFITRFRKDLTGGLNEEQILSIKLKVAQLRALTERKTFVLKSIESQGKLTEELKTQINRSTSSRRLEDLYLPFKPKKQTRASLARQQGLEPLAEDIFNGVSPDVDLATRATDFVRVDKGLKSVDEVIKGVGDLIAERLSENDELRSTLRKIMWNEGKLTSVAVEKPTEEPDKTVKPEADSQPADPDAEKLQTQLPKAESDPAIESQPAGGESTADKSSTAPVTASPTKSESVAKTETENPNEANPAAISSEVEATVDVSVDSVSNAPQAAPVQVNEEPKTAESDKLEEKQPVGELPSVDKSEADKSEADKSATVTAETGDVTTKDNSPVATKPKKKKKKKKKAPENPFKDYADFKQSLKQLPNHRFLAINRGFRAGSLKVKIELPPEKLTEVTTTSLVPAEHPFKEFMESCANDALTRLVFPSLEREIRRELTETAEKHAVEVFANNLRNLLLQPPVRNRTVLAIDPGFKRGCSVAVLDPCGSLLDSGHVFVVGNQTRRDESKQKIADWVKQHHVDVIAIGNGAACRQTEQMVSDTIAEQLQELKTTYTMVNGAGASIYSTSEIGREEMPNASPSIRSAASIGRRLQDPLSELVKISPANIGVGMYQHDVKAKHLSESLDEVVRFCVNRVGVDVNIASPSLLKYVSGLNSLTARRVVDHRATNGQFKNRAQLKEVNGFGDATFVQSVGFLRIHDGDTPLDCTSIHPESYDIAKDMLAQIDVPVEAFFPKQSAAQTLTTASANNAPISSPQSPEPQSPEPQSQTPKTEQPETAKPPEAEPQASSDEQTPKVESVESLEQSTDAQETVAEPTETSSPSGPIPAESSETATTVPDNSAESSPIASVESPQIPSTDSTDADETQSRVDRKEILKKISELDVESIATSHSAGMLLVKDIVMALKRPKWDPRDKVSKPIFRRGIIKADDLKPEMQLDGQVVNVVDFGVFVDIGLGESSLVHVSQLSNHFIRDPHRLFSIGDVLKVWVSEIDSERRRVKLTAVRPGSKKPQSRRPRGPARSHEKGDKGTASTNKAGTSKPNEQSAHSNFKPGKFGGGPKGRGNRSSSQRTFSKEAPRRTHVRRKPKDIKPITDKMLKGDEPMRSFSDLAQFVSKKPESPKEKQDSKKDGGTDSSTK